jgi:CheY-like chemotaxis protein
MGELSSSIERRRTMRAPVRGVAVLHAESGPLHGALENLSRGGALLNVASTPPPSSETQELELRFAEGGGWGTARILRVEQVAARWRIAVVFGPLERAVGAAIDAAIDAALAAARRRPILVIDDRPERRASLIERLSDRGMTPLAPRTPLEAIDMLTRAHLHVCLLAPGFGIPATDLAALLSDSFPWVTTTEISDDLEATAGRAAEAWADTAIARALSDRAAATTVPTG